MLDFARSGSSAPTVLLVVSCPWTARALEVALGSAGLATVRAPDVDSAARLCASAGIDAVLVDELTEPRAAGRGRATCRRIVAAAGRPMLPLVVLARDPLDTWERDALVAAGAWSIAPYPSGGSGWVAHLAVWACASRDVCARIEQGLVDPLTGLYNVRGLERRTREIEATLRRTGGGLACAVFAASIGETLVADACRRVGRACDVFGRLGDGRFAVVAPGTDATGVRRLVRRIFDVLAEDAPRAPDVRLGVCDLPDAAGASLTITDMLSHASSRM